MIHGLISGDGALNGRGPEHRASPRARGRGIPGGDADSGGSGAFANVGRGRGSN